MKKICVIMAGLCVFLDAVLAQDAPEIISIRKMYADTQAQVSGGQLYTEEIYAKLLVIPGIGSPIQRVIFYHAMKEGPAGDHDFTLCFTTYYYQHAGRLYYEELLFNAGGDLVFYFGKQGSGDINQPGGAEWQSEERYYFWKGKLVRSVTDKTTSNNPGGSERAKSVLIQKQAKRMRALGDKPVVPVPVSY